MNRKAPTLVNWCSTCGVGGVEKLCWLCKKPYDSFHPGGVGIISAENRMDSNYDP